MKKSFLATLAAVFTVYSLNAQSLYVKAGAGYGIPVAGQTMDASGLPYSGNVNIVINNVPNSTMIEEDYELKRVSMMSGMQAKLGVGYNINSFIAIEVDALIGAVTKKYTIDYAENDNGVIYKESTSIKAKMPAILTPSVVMQVPGKTLTCYARGGVAIPVANKLIVETESEENFDPTYPIRRAMTLEINTRLGVGFSGAMGLKYNLGKNIQLWGEASLLSLSLYTREQTLTEYTVNGSSVLSYIEPSQKHQVYELSNSTGNANASNVLPAYSLPYSNIGIFVGISTRL